MNTQIRYAAPKAGTETPSALVRLLRVVILTGVWILVGLAGLAVWARIAT